LKDNILIEKQLKMDETKFLFSIMGLNVQTGDMAIMEDIYKMCNMTLAQVFEQGDLEELKRNIEAKRLINLRAAERLHLRTTERLTRQAAENRQAGADNSESSSSSSDLVAGYSPERERASRARAKGYPT
jgi:hypothetical protein